MATDGDVTSAWHSVEAARDELLAYARPGVFFHDRSKFDALVEGLKEATDGYTRALSEWAAGPPQR